MFSIDFFGKNGSAKPVNNSQTPTKDFFKSLKNPIVDLVCLQQMIEIK